MGYDEFGLLHENADEAGLAFDPDRRPAVRRTWVETPSGHELSAIVWGDAPAELVLLHGGAQNAHTWDTVAVALGLPLVALDLPGHGHSAWRDRTDDNVDAGSDADADAARTSYAPMAMAEDIAAAIDQLAPEARTLVGMSLGGLTAIATLHQRPDLVERLVLVDITPGVNQEKSAAIVAFVSGPQEFESFDALLERTMAHNPTRSRSSLVRGLLHNAREQADGTWTWRYHRPARPRTDGDQNGIAGLWDSISGLSHPLLLVQGGLSGVVDDDDVSELVRRRPDAEVILVEDAGHSIQGDRPVELAGILAGFHR